MSAIRDRFRAEKALICGGDRIRYSFAFSINNLNIYIQGYKVAQYIHLNYS